MSDNVWGWSADCSKLVLCGDDWMTAPYVIRTNDRGRSVTPVRVGDKGFRVDRMLT